MALRARQNVTGREIAKALNGQRRRSKYNAVKTTVDGIEFDSRKEARRWSELVLLARTGEIHALVRQMAYPLVVNGHLIARYVSDFRYVGADGESVVEDVKGVRTPVYRLKRKLMAAIYGIQIREV